MYTASARWSCDHQRVCGLLQEIVGKCCSEVELLKAQKNRGIVKDPHAIQPELLEVRMPTVACFQKTTTTERKY